MVKRRAVEESPDIDHLRTRLDNLWRLRLSQANELVIVGVAELRAELGLPLGQLNLDTFSTFIQTVAEDRYGVLTQTLLLLGSVARLQRNEQRSLDLWHLAKQLRLTKTR